MIRPIQGHCESLVKIARTSDSVRRISSEFCIVSRNACRASRRPDPSSAAAFAVSVRFTFQHRQRGVLTAIEQTVYEGAAQATFRVELVDGILSDENAHRGIGSEIQS